MKLVFLISSLILAASSVAADSAIEEPDDLSSIKTEIVFEETKDLESILFHNPDNKPIAIEDVNVLELKEEICLGFDVSKYLPVDFNPLKGKDDLDWSKIELIELEEDIDLGFDTSKYLPDNFNAHRGMETYYVCSK